MASLVQLNLQVACPPMEASERLISVLREAGYQLDEESVPGASQLLFTRKRTIAWVRRQGGAEITANGSGATIALGLDVAPGQPAGLLDPKHNRKLVDDLRARIATHFGSE